MPYAIKRAANDRRSIEDRRKVYNIDYFENNGIERRHHIKDRRKIVEQKKRLDRINKWYTVYKGDKKHDFDYFLNFLF